MFGILAWQIPLQTLCDYRSVSKSIRVAVGRPQLRYYDLVVTTMSNRYNIICLLYRKNSSRSTLLTCEYRSDVTDSRQFADEYCWNYAFTSLCGNCKKIIGVDLRLPNRMRSTAQIPCEEWCAAPIYHKWRYAEGYNEKFHGWNACKERTVFSVSGTTKYKFRESK